MLKFAALALVAAVTVGAATESMAKGGGGGGGGGSRSYTSNASSYTMGGHQVSASGNAVSRNPGIYSGPGNIGHGTVKGPLNPGMGGNVITPGGRGPIVVGPIGPVKPRPPIGPVVTWPGKGPIVVGPGGGGGLPPGGGPKPVPPMQPPHHGHWQGGRTFVGGYQPAALYVPGNQECFQEQRRINGIVKLVKVCHEPN